MSFRDTSYQPALARDEARTLFAHTMALVAITAAFFAGGAYLGRDLSSGAGILWFIAAFACLFGIRFAVSRPGGAGAGVARGTGRRPPDRRRVASAPSPVCARDCSA